MKRQWQVVLEEGDTQEGQQLALALAAVAGPEFIRSVLDCYSTMARLGGEMYVGTYRDKFRRVRTKEVREFLIDDDTIEQREVEVVKWVKVDPDEVGEWRTLGFAVHYESVAKLTGKVTGSEKEKDDRLTQSRPLETANGGEPKPSTQEADREALEAIETQG